MSKPFAFEMPPPPTEPCADCGEPAYFSPCSDCTNKREREANRRRAVQRELAGIPPRYRDARFGSAALAARVADARAVEVARTALQHHQVLILQGSPGAGKSTLAAATAVDQAEQGRTLAWAPSFRLAAARAEARLGAEPSEIRDAIRADVLVVDDLGNEALTPSSAVLDVLFARHDAQRPIIVTTGLARRALAERYGGGAGRRLLEGALVVEMRLSGGNGAAASPPAPPRPGPEQA